ncbi:condensation domain-containing protein [Mycobacterium timonense]|uniref:condensation domain-containing protein n=1 Tax=Mycobacterium timonense TaxID=701043 RepID=UPI0035A2A3B9
MRPSTPQRATRSIWPPRSHCTRLFRVADDEHVLVAVVHHIASDGWSITALVRDLGLAYASRCAGRAPGWAPLPVQYADYTLWQRAQLGDVADSESPIAAQLVGSGSLPGCPSGWRYPRIAPTAGGRLPRRQWSWTGRPNCSSRLLGSPASTTRPSSW